MSEAWPRHRLSDLTTKVGSGATPKGGGESYKTTGTPLIRSMNVVFFGFKRNGLVYLDDTQAEQLASVTVQPGDVLLNITGASIGRVSITPTDLAGARVNQHVCIIRPNAAIAPRFLAAYLSSPDIQALIARDNFGATRQALTRQQILDFVVPVPSKGEQTRIADQLDTLLARIKACNDHLDAIPGLLKRFRQAVLLSATSGELTADWREAASTDSWVGVKIGDLIDGKPRNGYSPKAVEYETQVRSLTLTATTSGRFLAQHTKYIDEEIPGDSHLWLEPGDILIQRANTLEYVGVSAVFDGPRKSFIYPDLMMKCRPNHRVDGRFLFYLLSAEPTRQYFREHATGTAGNMPKINQQTVMSAQGALPPLDEQIEIVQRTENLLGLAKRIAQLHAAAKSHAQRLAPLTLAKAFLGELVPQDPKDETANALLARIAAKHSTPDCGSGGRTR
jgi:type I restriction enzyme S subunit